MVHGISRLALNSGKIEGMPKRALVLSGGGMFAAFQAGAWRSLAGRFQPDLVIGASAGALNGWTIASHIDPDKLCHFWLTLDQQVSAAPRLRWPRFFGDGILDTSGLEQLLRRVTAEYRPAMPLGVTVCEGPRLRNRVYWDSDITVDHLLASCAVPGLLPAKRLLGGLSFDGGLRVACPIWVAQELGATEIVALDAWTHLPWWWTLGRRRLPDHSNVWRIQPPARLGPLRHSAVWSPANAERWIAAGEAAAR